MAVKHKKREDTAPDRERLRRDKNVIVHQRATKEPIPFVSQFSLKKGVSSLEILRGDDSAKNDEHSEQ